MSRKQYDWLGEIYPLWRDAIAEGRASTIEDLILIADSKSGTVYRKIAQDLGGSANDIEALPALIDEYLANNQPVPVNNPPIRTIEHRGSITVDERILDVVETQDKTDTDLMVMFGYNAETHKVRSSRTSLYEQQIKGGGIRTMAAVRLEVQPLTINNRNEVEDIIAIIRKVAAERPAKPIKPRNYKEGGLTAEIDIADFHIGASPFDPSDPPSPEYVELLKIALATILNRLTGEKLEKIVLSWLGDFLHYDTKSRTTTSGTPMTYDLDPLEMFELGLSLAIWIVEQAAALAPVHIIEVRGNHDDLLGHALLVALREHFRNNKHITFDLEPPMRKWFMVGGNLIGLMHGHKVAKTRNKVWLIEEAQEVWPQVKYAIVHGAHFHSRNGDNLGMLEYTTARTPARVDEYHHEKAFGGGLRGIDTYLWHPKASGEWGYFVTEI